MSEVNVDELANAIADRLRMDTLPAELRSFVNTGQVSISQVYQSRFPHVLELRIITTERGWEIEIRHNGGYVRTFRWWYAT